MSKTKKFALGTWCYNNTVFPTRGGYNAKGPRGDVAWCVRPLGI